MFLSHVAHAAFLVCVRVCFVQVDKFYCFPRRLNDSDDVSARLGERGHAGAGAGAVSEVQLLVSVLPG